MLWGYASGWAWLWMAAMMILFWGGIIVLAVVVIRAIGGPKTSDLAMDVLRRRFASGEITQDEFERARKALQG